MRRAFAPACLLVAFVTGFPSPVSGQETGFTIHSGDLYRIDLVSTEISLVGPIGFDVFALALAPSGELFAVTSDQLLVVDQTTGEGTAVGPLGGATVGNRETGLAFDQHGQLWMCWGGSLYRIDLSTGSATLVTELDENAFSLAFLGSTLYAASERLFVVDVPTGHMTPVGDVIWSDTAVRSLSFDGLGSLFAIVEYYWSPGTVIFLATVNRSTGVLFGVEGSEQLPLDTQGLAIPPRQVPSIPTLDWRGLVLLVLAISAMGVATLRWLHGR